MTGLIEKIENPIQPIAVEDFQEPDFMRDLKIEFFPKDFAEIQWGALRGRSRWAKNFSSDVGRSFERAC
jgi:hypothetical protein